MLDAATTIADLRVPWANRLEKLKGDRAGQWSIRANDQWRLCFRWDGADAHDVELVEVKRAVLRGSHGRLWAGGEIALYLRNRLPLARGRR